MACTALVGTDISSTCLEQLQAAARLEGIAPERLHLFPADATDPSLAPAFAPIAADALLIMFTLSAVVPEQQLVMLAHAYGSLRPGGQLLIRDHGLYDMVQLRIPAEQWVEPNTYKRGDKTIAHFFSTEALAERARAVGFEVQECKYVTGGQGIPEGCGSCKCHRFALCREVATRQGVFGDAASEGLPGRGK